MSLNIILNTILRLPYNFTLINYNLYVFCSMFHIRPIISTLTMDLPFVLRVKLYFNLRYHIK